MPSLVRLSSVFEVEREVGIAVVRPLLHLGEELSGEDMGETYAYVHVAVQLIPGINVGFLADVGAGRSGGIANDGTAGSIVERVRGACPPEIEPLAGHRPAAMRLNGDASANRADVLPAELIADTETIVRG